MTIPNLLSPVRIYLTRLDQASDAVLRRQCLGVLDAEEREKLLSLRHPARRTEFLAAHALVRFSLSRHGGLMPHESRFRINRFGKPSLVGEHGLDFNHSHTAGMVACVVTHGPACGIDVEAICDFEDLHETARLFFSASELAGMRSCTHAARLDYFYRTWTLREAYVKALGTGMSTPMQQLSFDELGKQPGRRNCGSLAGAAADWDFYQFSPSSLHRMALAVKPRGVPIEFNVHEVDLCKPGVLVSIPGEVRGAAVLVETGWPDTGLKL